MVTNDTGAEFASRIWLPIGNILGIIRTLAAAFRPQSNSMVERWDRHLKDSLHARATSSDWLTHLPWELSALRGSSHEEYVLQPSEAMFSALPHQYLSTPELLPTSEFLE
jgi:hypothetical protein